MFYARADSNTVRQEVLKWPNSFFEAFYKTYFYTKKFNFLPKNSQSKLKVLIRNDKAYPFSNIYLISKIKFEDKLLTDTLNINFEDEGIDIFKTNSLSVKNYSFILKDNINFGQDSVSVELKHAIRPANSSTAIKSLKGIISVGLLAE